MALDTLSGEITTKTRDEIVRDYLRDYANRNPDADVGPNSPADIDARTLADQLMPAYSGIKVAGNNVTSKTAVGDQLELLGIARGIGPKRPEVGSTGYVEIVASAAGGTILAGDELTEPQSSLRHQCIATAHYDDGDHVPIAGIDTGPSTNHDPDTVLQWSSPRPGISALCTVVEQTDGTGLTGGAFAEEDDDYRLRLEEAQGNPPASGNEAEYIKIIRETPGIRIEQPFVIPACLGPGTVGLTFTVPADVAGASRIPTAAQLAAVYAYVVGEMPGDDSQFMLTLLEQELDACMLVEWMQTAVGWINNPAWPDYFALGVAPGASGGIIVTAATDALNFVLETENGDYTDCGYPAIGTVIAFYDRAQATFRRKEFKTVTPVAAAGPWTIECETVNSASDTTYTPEVNQRCCPWSDSLQNCVQPFIDYTRTLGPGEQQVTFADAGRRQKRYPFSPKEWPNVVSEVDMTIPFKGIDAVFDVEVAEGNGTTTPGTPSTLLYLQQLHDLTIFPK